MAQNVVLKKFHIGDLVFAKMKFYPPWPAQLINIENNKYIVHFFGTEEIGIIKPENLFNYKENKDKFCSDKNLKRPNFREAIKALESVSKSKETGPIDSLNVAVSNTAHDASTVDDFPGEYTFVNGNHNVGLINPQTGKNANINAVKSRKRAPDKKQRGGKPVKNITKISQRKVSKIISARGRLITRKTFSRSFISELPCKKNYMRGNRGTAVKNAKITSLVPNGTNSNNYPSTMESKNDNMILGLIPPKKYFGITLGTNKTESFATASKRVECETAARKEAELLKECLEIGEIKLETVKDRIILDVPVEKLTAEVSRTLTAQMVERKTAVMAEMNFLKLCEEIRSCLGLKRAYIDKCLEQLYEFEKFQLNQLILLRNPDGVDIIRRLCTYVGNFKQWNVSTAEEARLDEKAEIIRQLAKTIYNNIKELFNYNTEIQFWDKFTEDAKIFEEVTQNIGERRRVLLAESSYRELLAARTELNDFQDTQINKMI